MQPKPNTQPPTTSALKQTPFQRMVARIAAALEKDNEPKHPGVMMPANDVHVDDAGGYGNVDEDTRPEFVKEDERGWTRLK